MAYPTNQADESFDLGESHTSEMGFEHDIRNNNLADVSEPVEQLCSPAEVKQVNLVDVTMVDDIAKDEQKMLGDFKVQIAYTTEGGDKIKSVVKIEMPEMIEATEVKTTDMVETADEFESSGMKIDDTEGSRMTIRTKASTTPFVIADRSVLEDPFIADSSTSSGSEKPFTTDNNTGSGSENDDNMPEDDDNMLEDDDNMPKVDDNKLEQHCILPYSFGCQEEQLTERAKVALPGMPVAIYDIVLVSRRNISDCFEGIRSDRQIIFTALPKPDGTFSVNLNPISHPMDFEDSQKYQCLFKFDKVNILYDCKPDWSRRGIARNSRPAPTDHVHKFGNYCDCEVDDLREVAWKDFVPVGASRYALNNMIIQHDSEPIEITFDGRTDDYDYLLLNFSMFFPNDTCSEFDIIDGLAKRRPNGHLNGSTFSDREKLITYYQKEAWESHQSFLHGWL